MDRERTRRSSKKKRILFKAILLQSGIEIDTNVDKHPATYSL